jgi:hypothetical protein
MADIAHHKKGRAVKEVEYGKGESEQVRMILFGKVNEMAFQYLL